MKFALVGVGNAGGRIVDRLHYAEQTTGRKFTKESLLAFDTDRDAFEEYDNIPLDRHVLVGDTHPDIRGEGVDGDVDLAAAVAREDRDELQREIDKLDIHKLSAIVLVGGLGGGTGGGVGSVLLERLTQLTDTPLYAIGVLPDSSESDQTVINATRSLQSYVRLADSVILFDNDEWHNGASTTDLAEEYDRLNDELTERVIAALALGELDDAEIAENTLDSSDLMKTLGTGGVATLGYASFDLDRPDGVVDRIKSLFSNGKDDDVTSTLAMRTHDLIKQAGTRRLTLPCSISSADRALIVLSGPPEEISRKGFEKGRYWLEQETGAAEIFAGDEPRPNATTVSASIVFANVTDVPRIEELQQRAVEAQQTGTTQPANTPD
jgi:cell division GTPase FtsZ